MAPAALAQASGTAASPPTAQPEEPAGYGYGPGMMGGSWGDGLGMMGGGMMPGWGGKPWPGMMGGWGGPGTGPGHWGGPAVSIADRLAALKDELNITAGETDAWNTYAAAVTAADQSFADGVKSLWHPPASGAVTPDQRFDTMTKMVALMKQGYDQKKAAADALMPHLTQYQQGQASEILPGLATRHGGRGMMGGW
ncbi:Spy/CpxP family protein refolding chaperone [Acidocella aromatica]|uniref:LTXXQ motif family protein n=1 Tax=Acidocella aromatica TaxID=1303579 RepID=A0A840VB28_9PROT|nr:hypothetical protein [Acidocella aromatica]MBB5373118.1 hypothetical protein [Acidocella aromatica]